VQRNIKNFGGGVKKKKLLLGAILVVLFIAPNAFADTINGSGGWQLFPGALDQSSPPHWDGSSTDGSELNIGYYLTKTGGFSGGTYENPGAIPFWGGNSSPEAGGTADKGFYFVKTAPSITASLRLEIGDNKGVNGFGWYDKANPGTLNQVFAGSDSPTTNKTFTIDQDVVNYGFYIKVNGLFYTTEGNPSDPNDFQHFAVFMEGSGDNPTYWIGMEDLTTNVDFDYNDMIVKIPPILPEPAAMLLLGSGLIGLAGFARRRFKK